MKTCLEALKTTVFFKQSLIKSYSKPVAFQWVCARNEKVFKAKQPMLWFAFYACKQCI